MNSILKTPKERESAQSATPFSSSSRTLRSPILTPRAAFGTQRNTQEDDSQTPRVVQEMETESEKGTHEKVSAQCSAQGTASAHPSPKQEYILKMKKSEEETLKKCQSVLGKIRQAMMKQKNISMDVKNGISELEELLDITGEYRRNWKSAETEIGSSAKVVAKTDECDIPTPVISKKKRIASSPAATRPGKKPKERAPGNRRQEIAEEPPRQDPVNETPIVKVNRKEAGRKRIHQVKPRDRSDAVIIRPTEGHSFADVLKNLRSKVKPEETEVAVRSIRKTKTGAILLELGKGGRKEDFCDAIKGTLKEAADVKNVQPKVTLVIRDLDSYTTEEEVLTAIVEATDSLTAEVTIRLTEADSRGQRRAFVSLPAGNANALLRTERIKIGWIRCRIRYREETKRCYRCFATGHMQWDCKGPDRKGSGICIGCGGNGHKLKECKNPPKCCLCSQDGRTAVDHLPGSRSCPSGKPKAR